jgi:SAM-dependent methyltransferase
LSVTGVEPSEGFLETARHQLEGRVRFYQGNASAIPLENASVDVVVSGLVLNFVPDQAAALVEMKRVTSKGGNIGAYVWDYAEKMELMRYFWDAAVQLDPNLGQLDEGLRFPLCRPEALTELFAAAKLDQIKVTAIDIPTPFSSFEDYWSPFLGGQGSAPAYAMSLEESARTRLRESIKERIPVLPDGSISMMARAWAVQARVAE